MNKFIHFLKLVLITLGCLFKYQTIVANTTDTTAKQSVSLNYEFESRDSIDEPKKTNGFKYWYNNQKTEGLSTLSDSTKPKTEKKWYESFAIRGYAQFRYNRLLETNEKLKCEQCDKSWGEGGGFFFRRIRVILYGQIGKHVYFYIQPDFASSASSTSLNFAQLRDAYFDLGIGKHNEYRFRIGQSKIPYGFENMQSSQNRLPLDRNDAMNSAVANERDLGIFFYWAPEKYRKLFSDVVKDGFKGSGDYGLLSFGVFNGQTANKPELNDAPHVVLRGCLPIRIKEQIIEPGIQAYSGKYTIAKDLVSTGTKTNADRSYIDQRIAGSFILYPKPFGIQAEYNFGRGPEFNTATDSIEVQKLHGGYVTLSYFIPIKKEIIFPFFRAQYYNGGKKHELDARSYEVKEFEIGIEWQPVKQFELTAMYTFSNRRFEDFALQDNHQKGKLLRLQAQLNF
ncbi:MAG: OprO/OprP family phosphate-selective porin [Chitinophagales bacterium]|nr:OprO/OprP family phosphate-selective porin [Chitinophagales bacterium]